MFLCLHFPALPLEAAPPPEDAATAVVDRHGSKRWLVACNAVARRQGARPGMAVPTSLALVPDLKLLDRDPKREAWALTGLAGWAGQFSDRIALDCGRALLWAEIGTTLDCLGGLDAILDRARAGLEELRYTGHTGVAPTYEAAAAVARVGAPPIRNMGELPAKLEPLSLRALRLDGETLETFGHGLGLRTVGELLALPEAQVARRFGPRFVDYLRRLDGRAADGRAAWRPPPRYQRRVDLGWPVDTWEALLFAFRRILGELEGYLRGCDSAVQHLVLEFRHEKPIPSTRVDVRTTKPLRDAPTLFALLRQRLERVELGGPTEVIRLRVPRLVPLGETQGTLFGSEVKNGDWTALLDKLRARLGDDMVRQIDLHPDHRPEHAWRFVALEDRLKDTAPDPDRERPLWLLEQPRRLTALPPRCGTPERIESGWWSGHHIQRDYYTVTTDAGMRWWLFRDGEDGDWFLHGLWS